MIPSVPLIDKRIFIIGALIFVAALGLAIYTQNYLMITLPFVIGIFAWSIVDIRSIFYLLLFTIPLSMGLDISFDFPDEFLMLFLSLLSIFVIIRQWPYIKSLSLSKNGFLILMIITLLWLFITCLFSTNPMLSFKFFLKKLWYVIPFFVLPLIIFQEKKNIVLATQILLFPLFIIISIILFRQSLVGFRFDMIYDPLQPFFLNHVLYGSMVSCSLPLAIGALYLSRKLSMQWLFALATIIILTAATYFSYSRGAWMAIIFAGFVFFAIRNKFMHIALIAFYALIISGVVWLSKDNTFMSYKPVHDKTVMHETLKEHIIATLQGTDISSAERYYRWIAALRMSGSHPIVGVGPNNFYENYKPYAVKSFRTWVSRNPERSTTHNYFIYLLVEQGYPAMLLYAFLYFMIFYQGQKIFHQEKNRKDKIIIMTAICILGAIFVNNFLSELLETDKIGSLFYLSLSVLVVYQTKQLVNKPSTNMVTNE